MSRLLKASSLAFSAFWDIFVRLSWNAFVFYLLRFSVVIVDFPDKNKFLTKEETNLIKARVEQDRADSEFDPLTLQKCFKYSRDPKLWGKWHLTGSIAF